MKISIESCDETGVILFLAGASGLAIAFLAKYYQNKNHIENVESAAKNLSPVLLILLDSVLSSHPALLNDKGKKWQFIGLAGVAVFLGLGVLLFNLSKNGIACAIN